jgi:ribosomal protein L11 methyltransferase
VSVPHSCIDFVLEISFASDDALAEEVLSRLFLSDSSGSSSDERGGMVTVTAYFDSSQTRAAAMAMFRGADVRLTTDDRAPVDWLEKYQQSLHPLFIGRSFVVAPDGSLIPPGSDRHRIVVPQEQAFGTGSHETTWLCIEMLEGMSIRGQRGLDVGSGSGILALAMLRLGASKAIAFDADADAYGPLRDNRMRNGVAESALPMFIGSAEALRGGTFDVITMNIIPEVIIPMLPDVIGHMSAGGSLILGGILRTRRADVIGAASVLHLVAESSKGEWWCGRFQRAR